jgi:alpha-tubulin suppressor-like RCC1 family protein
MDYGAPGQLSPTLVAGVFGPTSLALGSCRTCVRMEDTHLHCWGERVFPGPGNDHAAPTMIYGLDSVAQAAIGSYATYVLQTDGTVRAWGQNDYGEMGNSQHFTPVAAPALIAGLAGATELSAGSFHACVRTGAGAALCWGSNSNGQVGNGQWSRDGVDRPAPVVGLDNVLNVAAGALSTCALRGDQTVWCWGANGYGELGDGTTQSHYAAAPVAGLAGVTALTAGNRHFCALTSRHEVFCWGHNEFGQLGDGTRMNRTRPTRVTFGG